MNSKAQISVLVLFSAVLLYSTHAIAEIDKEDIAVRKEPETKEIIPDLERPGAVLLMPLLKAVRRYFQLAKRAKSIDPVKTRKIIDILCTCIDELKRCLREAIPGMKPLLRLLIRILERLKCLLE